MHYYLYLRKGNRSYTLGQAKYGVDVRQGFSITFSTFELYQFERTFPELKGMKNRYTVTAVYECDGMGGIILE